MKKIILFVLVIAMAFTLAACGGEEANNSSTGQTEQSTEQAFTTTELTVWGMTCNRCVNSVKKAVSALDGVISVSVDLKAERVTVEHDPELDVDTIKESITAEGYNIP
jgi:copper chaperone